MSKISMNKWQQFHHENKTWLRSLDYFGQENIALKFRLSEVLEHSTNKKFLDEAEEFQNKFLSKDELIKELKEEILLQQKRFADLSEHDNAALKAILNMHNKLGAQLENLENGFGHLKYEFNKYISSIL